MVIIFCNTEIGYRDYPLVFKLHCNGLMEVWIFVEMNAVLIIYSNVLDVAVGSIFKGTLLSPFQRGGRKLVMNFILYCTA